MNAALHSPNGIAPNMPAEQYHQHAALSNSQLRDLAQSPWHYWQRHRNPDRPPPTEKAGQLEGELAHCAILEPAEFPRRYAVLPPDAPRKPTDAQWNAKAPSADSVKAMNWWRDFMADHHGQRIITTDQCAVAMKQAEAVYALPEIRALLSGGGQAESSAFWFDPITGVECRCRPDFAAPVGRNSVILIDVKTFADASPQEFERQVARKDYHRQDAFYSMGYAAASGLKVEGFIFVAVEDSWPFAASASMLDDVSRDAAQTQVRGLIDLYARCQKANHWPAYGSDIHQIRLPAWAL